MYTDIKAKTFWCPYCLLKICHHYKGKSNQKDIPRWMAVNATATNAKGQGRVSISTH